MKKLMIAAAIAFAAVASQAATYTWRMGATSLKDGAGAETAKATTMTSVYLFNSRDFSQQTLLNYANGLVDGKTIADALAQAVGTGTLSSGKMSSYVSTKVGSSAGSTYAAEGTGNLTVDNYFAVYNEAAKKLFISETLPTAVEMAEGDTTKIGSFSSYSDPSKLTFDKDVKTFTTGSGAGWYQVGSAVPEPTSGLLLLLGVAGLALRRRRA